MLFSITCTDKPGALATRMATRPDHLVYLNTWAEKFTFTGPMLDAEGRPCGSLILLNAEDRAEAERFAAGDPYAKAGLFESVVIRQLRPVFRDGVLVE
ncbi:YciI family protein [Acetobacter sp. AN02]|uniref:YciI family protein n=1 Tax=Acetobacter sp. AN02 TaxID=2894186 RepID=UPI00243450C6|nr:YciI family protein [Acetobacter sp. AN02]MDG6094563.1 YciI family protein [Acetobacter sp. AN02]